MPENPQYQFWNTAFAEARYYYGFEPGPVARRAVRYHRPAGGVGAPAALDIGCGEGQDLAFLTQEGYNATGLEWTQSGGEKSRKLLRERGLEAEVIVADWQEYSAPHDFDLVLAVNSLQFMGENAFAGLERAIALVARGGVLGLSLFAREDETAPLIQNGVASFTMDELLARFDHLEPQRQWQMLETAKLWQWNRESNQPQPFLTLVAQRLK